MSSQNSNISIKAVKEKPLFFAIFSAIALTVSEIQKFRKITEILKHADITRFYKNGKRISMKTKEQSPFFEIYQKYLKTSYLKTFFENIFFKY